MQGIPVDRVFTLEELERIRVEANSWFPNLALHTAVMHDHDGGVLVEGKEERQWVFFTDAAGNQLNLSKLLERLAQAAKDPETVEFRIRVKDHTRGRPDFAVISQKSSGEEGAATEMHVAEVRFMYSQDGRVGPVTITDVKGRRSETRSCIYEGKRLTHAAIRQPVAGEPFPPAFWQLVDMLLAANPQPATV